MMGDERRSLFMTEEEKTTTAYHESGHTLCALTSHVDPVPKVSDHSARRAAGMLMQLRRRPLLLNYEQMTFAPGRS